MKKNESFYFLTASLLSIFFLNAIFKKQNIKQIKSNVSLDQYKNRLKEFFSEEYISDQIKNMCEYINHGISAESAFFMVIQGAEVK